LGPNIRRRVTEGTLLSDTQINEEYIDPPHS
jgi:hypothetical protein